MTIAAVTDASLDAVVAMLYRSISGPAGMPRDWAAMEAAFLPDARLTRLVPDDDGGWTGTPLSLGQYRASREPLFVTLGFHEFETRRVSDIRGPLAQVFSWFTGRASPGGEDLLRGVNAIQLVRLDGAWRIAALSWYREFDVAEAHGYVPVEVR